MNDTKPLPFYPAKIVLVVVAGLLYACGDGDMAQRCRIISTSVAASGESIGKGFPNVVSPVTSTCEFDAQVLQLSCTAGYINNQADAATLTKIWTYASIADFMRESNMVGTTTSKSLAVIDTSMGPWNIIPDRPIQGKNSFDATGTLISSDNIVFTAWDTSARPLSSAPTEICTTDQGHRYIYDDVARQVIHTYNTRTSTRPPDGSIPCIPVTRVTKFDSQGNVTDIDAVHYTVMETRSVCL